MADDVLRFGKIEILEWLRPGEMKTGRDLFDEVEPMGIASTRPSARSTGRSGRGRNSSRRCARSRMNSAPLPC